MTCPSATRNISVKEKLDYYSIPEPNSGCWLWIGGATTVGYGKIFANGFVRLSHRVSYEEYKGAIPEGMLVLHKCDTPACINPEHLFLGTNKENMQDASRKGRTSFGEKNGSSKITEKDAILILNSAQSVSILSRKYNITETSIRNIKNGDKWSYLNQQGAYP